MKIFLNILTSIFLVVLLSFIGYNMLYKHRRPEPADLSAEHVRSLREQYDSIANEYQEITYHNETFTREQDNVKIKLTDEDNKLEMEILIQDENIMIVYPVTVEDGKLKIGIEYANAKDMGWHEEDLSAFVSGIGLILMALVVFLGLFFKVNVDVY